MLQQLHTNGKLWKKKQVTIWSCLSIVAETCLWKTEKSKHRK